MYCLPPRLCFTLKINQKLIRTFFLVSIYNVVVELGMQSQFKSKKYNLKI